jgi:hypothetical protein
MKSLVLFLICFVVFVFTIVSDAEVIGYWNFDNSNNIGEDYSGKGNDGQGEVNAQWTKDGRFGGGLKLDGKSWLEVPHDDSLNVKKEVTLMCWVIFDEVGNFYQSLIWKNAPFEKDDKFWSCYALRVFRSGLNIGGFGFDANTTKDRTITNPGDPDYPEAKKWYHATAIANGSEVIIYTNGEKKASTTQNGDFQSSKEPLTIGFDLRKPAEIKEYTRGIIDEAAVFNHAFTYDEVRKAMEQGVTAVLAINPKSRLATTWASIKEIHW